MVLDYIYYYYRELKAKMANSIDDWEKISQKWLKGSESVEFWHEKVNIDLKRAEQATKMQNKRLKGHFKAKSMHFEPTRWHEQQMARFKPFQQKLDPNQAFKDKKHEIEREKFISDILGDIDELK